MAEPSEPGIVEIIARDLERLERSARGPRPPAWLTEDLTFGQLRVLMLVHAEGPVSIGRVAERLGVSLASASETIDRIERHELVVRQHRTDDRRIVECRLSALGEQLVGELAGLRLQAISHVLGVLTPAELADLGRLVHAIAERILAPAAPQERIP